MKLRPKSKSQSRPRSVLGGESGDEVVPVAAESGTATKTSKGQEELAQGRNGSAVKKGKGASGTTCKCGIDACCRCRSVDVDEQTWQAISRKIDGCPYCLWEVQGKGQTQAWCVQGNGQDPCRR
ncbi:hypothetical protein L210DRAFT_1060230 [Boletus edulis BED1]|uniref:Uncharacterized protein n=1 Tax=Boletus edulis BED1 TaxID=1328754 RepID=A0AAD4BF06_BOLED|nr:hypothetical protein L210DRAFT_1060230 [Boletus edulis BED1]